MKIKIENPNELVKKGWDSGFRWDMEYRGEGDGFYVYWLKHPNYGINSIRVEMVIYKEITEVYDPYKREFHKMVKLHYKSNEGRELKNEVKIQTFKSLDTLLESISTTMVGFD